MSGSLLLRRWQHISAAPRDGTHVELKDASGRHKISSARFEGDRWLDRAGNTLSFRPAEWRARRSR